MALDKMLHEKYVNLLLNSITRKCICLINQLKTHLQPKMRLSSKVLFDFLIPCLTKSNIGMSTLLPQNNETVYEIFKYLLKIIQRNDCIYILIQKFVTYNIQYQFRDLGDTENDVIHVNKSAFDIKKQYKYLYKCL